MGQAYSRCLRAKAEEDGANKAPQVARGIPLAQVEADLTSQKMLSELQSLRAEVEQLKSTLASVNAIVAPIPRLQATATAPKAEGNGREFDRVQFIPLLMMSGPHSAEKEGEHDTYVGLRNVRDDFVARVGFVERALTRAEELADKDPRTLKVFSLPEFFFRGPIGAYSLQDVLGDAAYPASFILQLQVLLQGPRWQSWLGIFGTIVAYQIAPGKRFRLHNVYNICLCQHGGFTTAAERGLKTHFILKHWVSTIDFLDGGGPGDEGMVVADDEHWLEKHQQHYLDGLRAYGRLQDDCLVRIGGVTIGLEVCLDHAEQRLIKSEPTRKYQLDHPIEMQLVISAGMSLVDESIVVRRPGGLAFINDGLGTNDGATDTRTDGRLYTDKDNYERLAPELHPAFPNLPPDLEAILPMLFCLDDEQIPTAPTLAVYKTVKVTNYDHNH